MPVRVGIELSGGLCRIVQIPHGLLWRRSARDVTPVRAFSVSVLADGETMKRLRACRRHQVAVVAWGLRSEHRQVVVDHGSHEEMCGEAVAALRQAGFRLDRAIATVAPVDRVTADDQRHPVLLAAAGEEEIARVLSPIAAAGIRPRSLLTPALALASVARARRALDPSDLPEAYVALAERATCLALVRGGVLFAAREIAWGFGDVGLREPEALEAIVSRLGLEIVAFAEATGAAVAQVWLCGALPSLRTMAVLLTARLDIEVEPLDSLFGIDEARLPGDGGEFRDRGSELRLAWAAAADWPAPVNLMCGERTRLSRGRLARVAMIAGLALGLGASAQAGQAPPTLPLTSLGTERPAPPAPKRKAAATNSRARAARPPQATAFDATLETILSSPQRRLAIIDGRIVQVGDRVRDATVVDISETTVFLRDAAGRPRVLSINGPP